MKYSIVTFGCRVNQADSLALEAEFHACGCDAVPSREADLVVVNTCSVTACADQGARQTIRRIARENPAARIIATGCYATRCAQDVAALPGVVAVVPNRDKDARTFVAHLVGRPGDGPCGRPLSPGLMGRTAWTLRVQTGCDEPCSYCIIPKTRGTSRSRSSTDVLREIETVVTAGYREIALTGVHLGAYGRDLPTASSLAELLDTVGRSPMVMRTDARFRISSLEPMDCTEPVIDLVAAGSRFAPHFHLPLQHACNRVLGRMRRPYSIETYHALVTRIRRTIPHAAIGSDVIAGFPGETDDDFNELTMYLERSPLTHLHVFPYSERPDTDAARLDNKVDGATIKQRAHRLREISRTLSGAFRASFRGKRRPALTIDDGSIAVTDNYIRVAAPPGSAPNEWVTVTL